MDKLLRGHHSVCVAYSFGGCKFQNSFSYDSVVIPSMVECIHIAENLKGISISAAFKRSDIYDPRQYAQVRVLFLKIIPLLNLKKNA